MDGRDGVFVGRTTTTTVIGEEDNNCLYVGRRGGGGVCLVIEGNETFLQSVNICVWREKNQLNKLLR